MQRREETTVPGVDLDSVIEVVERAPVAVAVLYGSVARGERSPRSDIDIAVGFESSLTPTERTEARLSLLRNLTVELGTDDIDVSPLSGMPSDVLEEIRRDGILLVGSPAEFESHLPNSDTASGPEDRRPTLGEIVDDLEEVV